MTPGAWFQKVTSTEAENTRDPYVKQLFTLGVGDHKNFLFVSFLSDKTIEKSIPFSYRERPKSQKWPPKLIYMGFELNRQKTEKPTSLNIYCSRASQLVTKSPPDRVVMKTFWQLHHFTNVSFQISVNLYCSQNSCLTLKFQGK